MKVWVTITKELDETWGPVENLADHEIRALVQEDVREFLDGASWDVVRAEEACAAVNGRSHESV